MNLSTQPDVRVAPSLEWLNPKETAAHIRRILKAAFPATKFSVITERGSMVSSVRIGYTDGPTVKRVEALVNGFEAGSFDGMTDSYNYDRDCAVMIDGVAYRPGCRYVFVNRELSPRAVLLAMSAVMNYGWAWASPELEAKAHALLENLKANPTQEAVNALHRDGWNLYPGDSGNWQQGRNLTQYVMMVAADRTDLGR